MSYEKKGHYIGVLKAQPQKRKKEKKNTTSNCEKERAMVRKSKNKQTNKNLNEPKRGEKVWHNQKDKLVTVNYLSINVLSVIILTGTQQVSMY